MIKYLKRWIEKVVVGQNIISKKAVNNTGG